MVLRQPFEPAAVIGKVKTTHPGTGDGYSNETRSRRPNGTASPSFVRVWPHTFSNPSRRAHTSSSKAASSVRSTSNRTERARKQPLRRLPPGRFEPTLCVGWTAANQSRKQSLPVLMRRTKFQAQPRTQTSNAVGLGPRCFAGVFFYAGRNPDQADQIL
jgi:hypothetical protein